MFLYLCTFSHVNGVFGGLSFSSYVSSLDWTTLNGDHEWWTKNISLGLRYYCGIFQGTEENHEKPQSGKQWPYYDRIVICPVCASVIDYINWNGLLISYWIKFCHVLYIIKWDDCTWKWKESLCVEKLRTCRRKTLYRILIDSEHL